MNNDTFKHISSSIQKLSTLTNIEPSKKQATLLEHEIFLTDSNIGFICRSMAFASIPHSKVKGNHYTRTSNNFTISITGNEAAGGVPYGTYPRLILCWLTSEITKTKNRRVILGSSLTQFMHKLGISATGGRWGTITRFKSQIIKLFTSNISLTCHNIKTKKLEHTNMSITEKASVIWDPTTLKKSSPFGATIILGESFFKEVINSPVPINIDAVYLLKSSSLALDIYFWLTYRMSYLKHNLELPFHKLQLQFGIGYSDTPHGRYEFKRKFLHQLKNVLAIYPEAKVQFKSDSIVLSPSITHIKKRKITYKSNL